ncbi:MAG: hypothetical protein WDW36_009129 [Sanguina aurantia]
MDDVDMDEDMMDSLEEALCGNGSSAVAPTPEVRMKPLEARSNLCSFGIGQLLEFQARYPDVVVGDYVIAYGQYQRRFGRKVLNSRGVKACADPMNETSLHKVQIAHQRMHLAVLDARDDTSSNRFQEQVTISTPAKQATRLNFASPGGGWFPVVPSGPRQRFQVRHPLAVHLQAEARQGGTPQQAPASQARNTPQAWSNPVAANSQTSAGQARSREGDGPQAGGPQARDNPCPQAEAGQGGTPQQPPASQAGGPQASSNPWAGSSQAGASTAGAVGGDSAQAGGSWAGNIPAGVLRAEDAQAMGARRQTGDVLTGGVKVGSAAAGRQPAAGASGLGANPAGAIRALGSSQQNPIQLD